MSELIILKPLEIAIRSLGEVIDEYNRNPNEFTRDASIQRFEYTYELGFKMLKRFLEATSANPAEVDNMSFQDVIRFARERGLLLHTLKEWNGYRSMRNTTSHAYNEKKAIDIVQKIPAFYDEALYLLKQLQANNKQDV